MATHAAPLRHDELPATISGLLGAITWFIDALEGAQRTERCYDRLATLSDETLAKRGLSREDLPAAAFRDCFKA